MLIIICSLTGLQGHAKSALSDAHEIVSHSYIHAAACALKARSAVLVALPLSFSCRTSALQRPRNPSPPAGRGAGPRAAGVLRPAVLRAAAQPGDLVRCTDAPSKGAFEAHGLLARGHLKPTDSQEALELPAHAAPLLLHAGRLSLSHLLGSCEHAQRLLLAFSLCAVLDELLLIRWTFWNLQMHHRQWTRAGAA